MNHKTLLAAVLLLKAAQAHAASDAAALLKPSGVQGGLAVVVGCNNVDLLADLGKRKSFLVQGLDTRDKQIGKARAALQEAGLSSSTSAIRFDGSSFPYIDNLVNLLVADQLGDLRMDEVMRVLAPGGVAMIGGKKTIKNFPAEIDEWTHHMYDTTGIGAGNDSAVTQPRSMQWKAGPEYSRSHENMSSVSAVVSAGRRVFSIMDEGPTTSIYLPSKWFLTARDAFSGVLLWKVPISEWHARLFPLKSGPMQLPRRLVASGDRVYVTLGLNAPVTELDAATGEVLQTFQDTKHAEELLFLGGKLLVVASDGQGTDSFQGKTPESRKGFLLEEQAIKLSGDRSLVLIDTKSGRTIWKTTPATIIPLTTASDGASAYFMRGDELVAADMRNGKDIWTSPVKKTARLSTTSSPTLLVHQDIVYLAKQGTLTARDAKTGKERWSAPCATSGYQAPASIFIVNNLIWDVPTGGEPYRPGTDLDEVNRHFTGYHLRTGEVVKQIPVSSKHGYAIMHHRCHIPRASGKNIVTSFPGIEFFDVESGKSTHDSWIRGACLYGFMPANGLIYAPPHPCACYTQGKLTGFWAVAGARKIPKPTKQLTKGPGFPETPNPKLQKPSLAWPTYRGDAARSGTTPGSVPAKLANLWTTKVGPQLSQCVIANDKVFASTTDNHTVHALDAKSGKKLWSFTAGGRVDSAPTVFRDTVIFGSRDGHVYCLVADTGKLAWRFRAAPADRRCVAYDQVESVWPVHGSVLVHNNAVWFCAGRSSFLDGGLLVYRLDPSSGEVLSTTPVDSFDEKGEQPPITHTIYARLEMEGAKNDVLSCDGNNVFMRHWAFDLEGKSVAQNLDHLFAPTGFLDTSWFRRTYWIYGQLYVSGAQGWARTGNLRPTGRIMSIDDERLYGFGRDHYPPSPGNQHQMYLAGEKERLFAAKITPTPDEKPPADPRERRKKKKKGAFATNNDVLWSTPGDLQIRGMLLAGGDEEKRLFVAGAKGDWVTSPDAHEGKLGSVLRVVSIEDGNVIAEHELPGLPIFDGMSAAGGRLFLSLQDGRVVCLGSAAAKTE